MSRDARSASSASGVGVPTFPWRRILDDMCSQNGYERIYELEVVFKEHLEMEQRTRPADSFAALVRGALAGIKERLDQGMHKLAAPKGGHGAELQCLGSLAALDQLLDVKSIFDSLPDKPEKVLELLYNAFASPSPLVVEHAARTLGHFLRVGGPLTADVADRQVILAIRELRGDRKFAAALKLRYLAEDVCAIFNVHVRDFIANIWEGLRDRDTLVREASVQALRACLMLVEARETRYRVQWYYRLFEETQRGLSKPPCTQESIHGSLLALGELLRHTGEFMLARYKEVVETVLRFRDSKDRQIRRAVISLIPRLAAFAPRRFAFKYLKTGVEYLITTLKVKEEKGAGFLAIADVALALGAAGCQTQMEPYLMRIAEHIQEAIASTKKGKPQPQCPQALQCAGALAKALGELWKPYATPLVEQMILTGLTIELIKALQATVDSIPELTRDIQDWLLDLLCLCLSGLPHRGSLGNRAKEALIQALQIGVHPGSAMPDLRQVRLALYTLGSFDFGQRRMLGVVEECVLPYMQHDREAVRKAAAIAAVQLLQRRLTLWQQQSNIPMMNHVRTVEKVVDRLLTAACADVDTSVRRCILDSLYKSTALDTYLAQADCLRALFVALNDEERVVRGLAIMVVGRLALRNPAYVMPALRRHLMQLLNDMNTAQDYSQREESAQLLGCLIKACPRLVLPYVPPILKALLNKLREVTKPPPYANNPLQLLGKQAASGESSVAATVLATTGELARVAGPALRPHMVELLKPIIDAVQDTTSMHKSLTAICTLGQVVESTGVVVSPYMEHPQLLSLLLRILTDGTPHARMEVVKVLGIIGALDPHTHKLNQAKLSGEGRLEEEGVRPQRQGVPSALQTGALQLGTLGTLMGDAYTELLPASGMLSNNEEYYPTVALNALMNALRNPAAAAHQTEVFNAMFTILRTLGLAAVPYLPKVMPEVLRHLHRGMEAGRRNQLLEKLTEMVQQLRQHMRRWLSDIVQLTTDFWEPTDPKLTDTLLALHSNLALALRDDMRNHLPSLLPKYIALLGEAERSGVYNLVPSTLATLESLESALEEHMQLLLPALVHLMDPGVLVTPPAVRSRTLSTMRRLLPRMALAGSASAVLHPLLRVLDGPDNALRVEALDTICALSPALGRDFSLFVPTIRKIVVRHGLRHPLFDAVASRMGNPTPPCMTDCDDWENSVASLEDLLPEMDGLTIQNFPPPDVGPLETYTVTTHIESTLKRAWESSQRSTKEDWDEWMRNFAVELLHHSASPALRATWSLAQSHPAMARDLFPAAFVCCWSGLSESMQDALVRSLEAALASPTIPAEIVTALLNLAEFMEHDEKSLPLDTRTLGALAEKCHAFAKALHYKELEFATSPETAVEALISINNQLRQPEAARGILTHARTVLHMELKESWYEKLGRWEEALEAYDRKLASWEGKYNSLVAGSAAHLEATLGRLRCLAALAEWERLSVLCQREWRRQEALVRRDMAAIAAHAAWHMGDWDSMSTYTATLKDTQESPAARLNGEFLSGVLRAHLQDWDGALKHVTSARELLGTELAALVSESYERAYIDVVRAQQLAELEEVIHYSQALRAADGDELAAEAKRGLIRQVWRGRLKGVQRNVEVWQALLSVRTLVLPMHEDTHTWLKFASLCRKSGRVKQSRTTLLQLLQYDPATRRPGEVGYGAGSDSPEIMFGFLKHQWNTGADRQDVLNRLEDLRRENTLLSGNGAASSFVMMQPQSPVAHARSPLTIVYGQLAGYNAPLSARIHLRSAMWRWALAQQDLDSEVIEQIDGALDVATREAPNWGKVWHYYALFNVMTLEHWSKAGDRQKANSYVAPAVKGFFSSIAIGQMTGNTRGSNLQDILRLLTLWFSHGEAENVKQALQEGFAHVSVDTWLVVIPQIIARIHTANAGVRGLIHGLLTRIGRHHPQALIYPLLVACKSQSEGRRDAAMRVLNNLRLHSPTLVEQAQLVSQELIRMAILWHEMWHEALEEASRQYFGENNVTAMMDTLFPLHRMMEAGPPTTLKEIAFVQAYGKELEEAYDSCKKFQSSGKEAELHQAWDLYYHVFKRINKQLPSLVTLDLQYVAPALIRAQSLELAVPGTYIAGEPLVTIAAFAPQLHVITSKQRPRKLTISGSDGAEYMFLLKGHEDLRQDERVMQLFGLVNNMLANDRITAEHGLSIARYAVIPLSPNSGLIGWVPNCDTLHTLIREYRDARKVPLNMEHRLMLGMAPDYDQLTVIQKVEVFEHALESTSGDDLHKVLWLKSRNSEVWLERRTFYTRSTAVMSMVGYLLGLGDRHPSNLMLDRYSGKLLHIDFGDCFEASMHREKFPEKVPFRLTRMMVKAMEVSGIEGNFRFTCEHVMRVLRANKDSVMAMLEAFVHDPLINWRLLNHADADAPEHPDTAPTTPHNDMSLQTSNLDEDESSFGGEFPSNVPLRGQREQETLRDFQNLEGNANEVLNERAVVVMRRMSDKLTGRDWMQDGVAGAAESAVESQVSRLILMATSHENLCQSYIGWCPFW